MKQVNPIIYFRTTDIKEEKMSRRSKKNMTKIAGTSELRKFLAKCSEQCELLAEQKQASSVDQGTPIADAMAEYFKVSRAKAANKKRPKKKTQTWTSSSRQRYRRNHYHGGWTNMGEAPHEDPRLTANNEVGSIKLPKGHHPISEETKEACKALYNDIYNKQ